MDDVMGDNKLQGFNSEISNFCSKSRHYNITCIYSMQTYTKLPSVVRMQIDVWFMFYMKPISLAIYKELVNEDSKKHAI